MMDGTTLSTLIGNLGFPIVACCYLANNKEKLRKTIDENTKTIEALKELFKLHVKECNVDMKGDI